MKTLSPLISIGIPLYNESKFISKTLESWLKQDYQNIEIIISDNCSTDNTYEICQHYAERDARIRLSQNSENLGAIFNGKKVIDLAKGKYFVLSSGHDDREPEFLTKCSEELETYSNVVLAYPKSIWIDENNNYISEIGGCIDTKGLDPISRLNVTLWGLGYAAPVYGLFRTESLRQVSMNNTIVSPDVLLLCQLSILGEFSHVPIPLLKMRRMGDFGNWDSYVRKVFNQPLSSLSVPELFWDMLRTFTHQISQYFSDSPSKTQVAKLTLQALFHKYGFVLTGLFNEKRDSHLSDKEKLILDKINQLQIALGQLNYDLLNQQGFINMSEFNLDHIDVNSAFSPIPLTPPQLQNPVILIDGVFFQLYKTGIARVWKSLLEQWATTEFGAHLLVLDRNNTAPKINGICYRTIPPYDYNNTEADRQMLQQICDEEDADLFISSYYTTPITTPSVFMAYDMIPEVIGFNLEDPMWREKHHAIAHATSYIAISENTAKDLQRFFPNIGSGQITVAHCGVSQNFSPPPQQAIEQFKYKYGIHKHYFLLGGLGGYKNGILFLQAFNQLTNQQSFDIVVTGPNHQLPAEWRELTAGCTFHSLQLSDEELRLAYAGAIALIYPSQYEGFGMPVIEAMACGCPVITTPNASLPEVAGDAALYVNDQDIDAMADALCEIQKPSVRKQLIERSKQQASRFSWATMADTVQNALLSAITPVPLGEINFIVFPDWQSSEQTLATELGTVIKTLNSQLTTDSVTLLIEASDIGPEEAELFITDLALSLTMEEGLTLNENLDIQYVNRLSSPQWAKIMPGILARFQLACDNPETIAQAQAEDLTILHCSGPNYLFCPDWRQELELVAEELSEKLTSLASNPNLKAGNLVFYAPAETLDLAAETLLDIIASLALERNLDLSEDWTISLVSDLSPAQWSALLAFIAARLSLPHEDATILDLLNS